MFLWLLGYHENFRFSLTLWLFKVLRRDCPKISGLQVSLIFKLKAPIYFQVSKGSLVYRFCKDRITLSPPPSERHTKKWNLVLCNHPILPCHGSLFSLLVQHMLHSHSLLCSNAHAACVPCWKAMASHT